MVSASWEDSNLVRKLVMILNRVFKLTTMWILEGFKKGDICGWASYRG
jgi:hypothetical protein